MSDFARSFTARQRARMQWHLLSHSLSVVDLQGDFEVTFGRFSGAADYYANPFCQAEFVFIAGDLGVVLME